MLEAIAESRLIVGAYTDGRGGVCPMLAAHRRGGRASLASFARAWDRYTGAGERPRPATRRELRALNAMLEASIAAEVDVGEGELARAIAEHREARSARGHPARRDLGDRRERRDTGERHRAPELRRRPGWAWLRPVRRYDEFERALRDAGAGELRSPAPDRAPAPT
jgi:hypothetical protein